MGDRYAFRPTRIAPYGAHRYAALPLRNRDGELPPQARGFDRTPIQRTLEQPQTRAPVPTPSYAVGDEGREMRESSQLRAERPQCSRYNNIERSESVGLEERSERTKSVSRKNCSGDKDRGLAGATAVGIKVANRGRNRQYGYDNRDEQRNRRAPPRGEADIPPRDPPTHRKVSNNGTLQYSTIELGGRNPQERRPSNSERREYTSHPSQQQTPPGEVFIPNDILGLTKLRKELNSVTPKGILRPPTKKFSEDSDPIRERAVPRRYAKRILSSPIWTMIPRRLVNPEALTMRDERFIVIEGFVIVLRILIKDEVQNYTYLRLKLEPQYKEYESEAILVIHYSAATTELSTESPI
ncbi:uncharacterized protein K444DRAFT_629627 [Hyaloscypha bicolor E]|uniref:DUF8035 domain-containing protein n=1 Tax=Hyaloscypha bicolor E TaxID=1095630 RepID=A0A2J6TB27_9HELO|nr:uncharacterized protein K444DRAFT_629627 [Hyaloscypha bicolor E]PMD60226.1 hypothetical protein K444DRAFT_629627 [Hyaloscypha bicolor E]